MRLSWQKEEGIGDNFGCESKEENSVGCLGFGDGKRIVEDVDSTVAETAHATEYYSVEDTASATRDVHASNQNMELIIRNLERELEEAQAAHASLYLELEKERSAAATAADEAMAMILRLQSEKAAVQMEARQYQRMIEEKSAYDGEEMEILKEIIVRRERENNFLQKEVEAYRQMLSGEITGDKPEFLFDSSEDPTLMLTTICESIRKKERIHGKMKHTDDIAGIHYPELPVPGEECKEKGIVTVEVYPSGECQNSSFNEDAVGYKLDGAQNLGFCEESSCLCSDDHAGRESNTELRIPIDGLNGDDKKGAKRSRNSSLFEAESSVLDVHVIEDKHKLGVEEYEKSSNILKMASAPELSGKSDVPDELPGSSNVDISRKTSLPNRVGVEQDIQRSYSEMTIGRQLLDTLIDNTSYNDMRSPMSSVDSKRFKLETEVEILRKRLKTIQQGRENLDFAMGYRENETFQLQLLEEIACQLQEIRKLTGPGRSTRQASLPPLSSKVRTKKRRSRSVSWGLNESA
ncbi:uncharacterized protein A4U43_C09F12050 [Asparagus officinalis]|uniref:GTD-binding domain-containing protein n=2 Tax=Asparagus officinalis TaxID=4686 RepID=A0A5P1E705_ASPOF|nr:uncharacterized protein A4U43_C09F12050 [Asparagus officinalis]